MLIGYARVSKADGSQSLDLRRDALRAEGIADPANLYHDFASGVRDDLPGLDSCLRALREADVLVVWKLDLVEHPEGALCLGVWRWIAPHNLTPRFVAASFDGVDSPTGRDTTGQPSLVARFA